VSGDAGAQSQGEAFDLLFAPRAHALIRLEHLAIRRLERVSSES
jgi:hypothetical protein